MGNCAIDRTAYIGGVLLFMQVFFKNFSPEQALNCGFSQNRRPQSEKTIKNAA
jgi:hypothetical protein